MAALIPGARRVTVPHCGHLSPIERPEAVTAELRAWLAA
jgi:pimeloyl-ACP methyl ester carboxylesterase